MTRVLHRLRSRPWLALALVVPGLLLRAAIPAGFMPSASNGTTFTVTMCPGHASMPVEVQLPGGTAGTDPAPRNGGGHHEPPCVFAAATGLAPVPFLAVVAAIGVGLDEPLAPPSIARLVRTPARAHAPRAPPLPA